MKFSSRTAIIASVLALCVPTSGRAAIPAVSAGDFSSAALRADGNVRTWGDDAIGQLGLGRLTHSEIPIAPVGLSGVQAVSAGGSFTVARTSNGRLWAWGTNGCGQLGDGTTSGRSAPAPVIGISAVVAVAAGNVHVVAVRSDGSVWEWGCPYLSLGLPTLKPIPVKVPGLSGVVAVSTATAHNLALKNDGTVWAWGANHSGQLGDGTVTDRLAPAPVPGLANIVAVSAGGDHSLALDNLGRVWAWGRNGDGQLGDGTTTDRLAPVTLGGISHVIAIAAGQGTYSHSVALRDDGTVWTWGGNINGQLGDGTNLPRSVPSAVPGLAGVVAIAATGGRSAAVRADGSVWEWGYTGSSFLATPEQRPGLSGIVRVSLGYGHAVAMTGVGAVLGWGQNFYGELGDGTPTTRSTPTPVPALSGVAALAMGPNRGLALKGDGSVWSWGSDFVGGSTPVPVAGLSGIVSIAAGWMHSLAARSDGTVWAWGANFHGELGDGTTTTRIDPVQVVGLAGVVAVSAGRGYSIALKGDGTVWMWGEIVNVAFGFDTIDQLTPVQVGGLSGITAISAGSRFSLAVKSDGTVWGWGMNLGGEIGDGGFLNRLSAVQVPGLSGATAVAAGHHHSLVLLADGTVRGWGANYNGEVGDGTDGSDAYRLTPVTVSGLSGATAIAVGLHHSLAVKADGSVRSWGANFLSQGGDGTYAFVRNRPVVVLAEGGAGSLDTNDWFLRLDPSKPATIPESERPKALAVARIAGSGSFEATVKYKTSEFGSSINNYVIAIVPPEFLDQVKTAPGTTPAKALREKSGAFVLTQLTPLGWTDVQGQLIAYSQGVASAVGGSANILDRVNTASYPGARFCIGYGQSADAMLNAQALREVLAIEGVTATASDVPCVLSGVYVSGPAASVQGTPVTFAASVIGLSPTGSVQFRDGPDAILSPVPLAQSNPAVGVASVTTASLVPGMHGIGVAYSGDAQNVAATSAVPLRHEVTGAAAGTRIELAGATSSALGDEVAFVASVTGRDPTGHVQFHDGGLALGPAVPLVQGVAAMRNSTLAIGSHSITASYSGDGLNAGVTSASVVHSVYSTLTTSVALSSSANPSGYGAPVTFTATVGGADPSGSVTFRDGATTLATVTLVGDSASVTVPSLGAGNHVVTADYGGDANNQRASSPALLQSVLAQAPASGPNAFAFAPAFNVAPAGAVTSNTIAVSGLSAAGPISVAGGSYSIGCTATFTTSAGNIANGQTVCVRHTAAGGHGAQTLTTLTIGAVAATFTSTTHSATFAASVSSLVTHYYQSILRRPADAGGQTFWAGEAMRVSALGASPAEAFYAMAMSFYASSEYAAFNRDASGFATDLYTSFFKRAPDPGGLAFWVGNLDSGMPREVLLATFLFSPEFAGVTQASFGGSQARAEVNAVMDFYRGLLARLPDDGGFNFWVGRFRAAQCAGAAAVTNEAEAISSAFALSSEYAARGRTSAQYVGDLYNAFLRRGGDLGGVQHWIGQVTSGAQTREQVRVHFRNSAEFQARVSAIVAQGCL